MKRFTFITIVFICLLFAPAYAEVSASFGIGTTPFGFFQEPLNIPFDIFTTYSLPLNRYFNFSLKLADSIIYHYDNNYNFTLNNIYLTNYIDYTFLKTQDLYASFSLGHSVSYLFYKSILHNSPEDRTIILSTAGLISGVGIKFSISKKIKDHLYWGIELSNPLCPIIMNSIPLEDYDPPFIYYQLTEINSFITLKI
jgi:hypothetical protein